MVGVAVSRVRQCRDCGVQYNTNERAETVFVRNPETGRVEPVPVEQIEQYRGYLQGRAPHPHYRNRRWDDAD